mmetsp:Transcript_48717/g.56187  ORF Transcript_48717/g.56187 Transcript_48717/m.56187 type:complete len:121 (-) Transcript_48717:96-458(-)
MVFNLDPALWELLTRLLIWSLVVVFFVSIYRSFQKKKSRLQGDTRERIWKRQQFANYDLFRTFDANERKEFIETFQNTVTNAEMFKDPKVRKEYASGSSSKKKTQKSVKFNQQLDILGPK